MSVLNCIWQLEPNIKASCLDHQQRSPEERELRNHWISYQEMMCSENLPQTQKWRWKGGIPIPPSAEQDKTGHVTHLSFTLGPKLREKQSWGWDLYPELKPDVQSVSTAEDEKYTSLWRPQLPKWTKLRRLLLRMSIPVCFLGGMKGGGGIVLSNHLHLIPRASMHIVGTMHRLLQHWSQRITFGRDRSSSFN